MFTGIIEEVGSVASVPAGSLVINASQVLKGMQPGGSIAVNGACLTATRFDDRSFTVDVMPETLRLTNLGQLRTGDRVNLERPLALGGEMGGHLVQGHVDGTGRIASITGEGGARIIKIEASPEVTRYLVTKGFIAVDGVSLTITGADSSSFRVSVVDYTRRHTTLSGKREGDTVNLEVDIFAKYVEKIGLPQRTGLTYDFLQDHGFLVN